MVLWTNSQAGSHLTIPQFELLLQTQDFFAFSHGQFPVCHPYLLEVLLWSPARHDSLDLTSIVSRFQKMTSTNSELAQKVEGMLRNPWILYSGFSGRHGPDLVDDLLRIMQKQVMIYVINSARDNLPGHLETINQDVFLIVDECHRAGSAMNRKIFDTIYDYKLGLSATPERRGDFGFEEVLLKHLGKVIYSYSDAREDGIIPPYCLKRIAVPLTLQESSRYEYYSKKIKKVATMLFQR